MIFFDCLIIIYEYEKLGEIVKYSINEIVVGEVTGIQPYGAFVKLESGETGLIHISEISSLFVKNISDYVKIGQQIRVKVIEILNDKNMYRLSYKQNEERRRQNVRKITSNKKRIYIRDYDFNALKENLDNWIEIELEKIKEEENA